jgi:hypothetical protein
LSARLALSWAGTGKYDAEPAGSKYQDVTKWLTTGGASAVFGGFGGSAVI